MPAIIAWPGASIKPKPTSATAKLLGKMGSYDVYVYARHGGEKRVFYLMDGKHVMLRVACRFIESKSWHWINLLIASSYNKVKAYDFYHWLITVQNITLVSDSTQTLGGKKTWEKLKDMPGVKVEQLSAKGEISPLYPNWEDHYPRGWKGYEISLIARKAT